MLRSDQPLWLPEGSVRAILALVLTAAAIAASFFDALPEQFLWPAALVVNGHYFGAAPRREAGGNHADPLP